MLPTVFHVVSRLGPEGPRVTNDSITKSISVVAGNPEGGQAEINPVFVEIVVPWLFGLIAVVGLVGNALVVLVVACNPQMRSTTNILIINLAIADLLFIVFCVPSTATDYGIGEFRGMLTFKRVLVDVTVRSSRPFVQKVVHVCV